MKKIFLFVLIAVFSFAGISNAEQSERYVGVKTGMMMLDVSGVDDITPLGIVYGQSLENVLPNLWVEGELNIGIAGGDFEVLGLDGEFDIWTIAAYAVYRHSLNDAAYLKGKAGLLHESFKMTISGFGSATDTETGLSFGVGGGYKINDQMTVEVEYTIIESDVDFLSVGLNYKF